MHSIATPGKSLDPSHQVIMQLIGTVLDKCEQTRGVTSQLTALQEIRDQLQQVVQTSRDLGSNPPRMNSCLEMIASLDSLMCTWRNLECSTRNAETEARHNISMEIGCDIEDVMNQRTPLPIKPTTQPNLQRSPSNPSRLVHRTQATVEPSAPARPIQNRNVGDLSQESERPSNTSTASPARVPSLARSSSSPRFPPTSTAPAQFAVSLASPGRSLGGLVNSGLRSQSPERIKTVRSGSVTERQNRSLSTSRVPLTARDSQGVSPSSSILPRRVASTLRSSRTSLPGPRDAFTRTKSLTQPAPSPTSTLSNSDQRASNSTVSPKRIFSKIAEEKHPDALAVVAQSTNATSPPFSNQCGIRLPLTMPSPTFPQDRLANPVIRHASQSSSNLVREGSGNFGSNGNCLHQRSGSPANGPVRIASSGGHSACDRTVRSERVGSFRGEVTLPTKDNVNPATAAARHSTNTPTSSTPSGFAPRIPSSSSSQSHTTLATSTHSSSSNSSTTTNTVHSRTTVSLPPLLPYSITATDPLPPPEDDILPPFEDNGPPSPPLEEEDPPPPAAPTNLFEMLRVSMSASRIKLTQVTLPNVDNTSASSVESPTSSTSSGESGLSPALQANAPASPPPPADDPARPVKGDTTSLVSTFQHMQHWS